MTRRRVLLPSAVALILWSSALSGQERVPGRSSRAGGQEPARCDSIVSAARVDSTRVEVRAFLSSADDDAALPDAPRELILQEIAARLELPRPLAVPVFGAGPTRLRMLLPEGSGERPERRPPVLHGLYAFRLLRSGEADSIRVLVPTLAPGFDSIVLGGIRGISRDHAFPLAGGDGHGFPTPLQLRITSAVPDPRLRGPGMTLFEAFFPVVRVVDAVPSPSNLPAAYPAAERDEGNDGDVLLQVVVDERGEPVLPTTEVLHATSLAFVGEAYRALAAYRFTPAHVDACPVPQQVRVPFWFSLRP